MSAHRTVSFVPQARRDHHDILLYSGRTWGREQVERYAAMLDAAIGRVRSFPESGRDCGAVLEGGRCTRCEHHLIYYTFDDHSIVVHRILHVRRHVTDEMFLHESDE